MTLDELVSWWEAEKKRYRALPWHKKAIEDGCWWIRHGFGHKWRDVKFAVRVWVNRAFRGYDEYDWWEYYSNASKRAVKLLPYLKNRGIPGSFYSSWNPTEEERADARARWTACLDDMIFFHRVCAGEIEDYKLTDDEKHRYRRGKYYYFKHYETLWD